MTPQTRLVLIGLLILFVAVRLPGLSTPYQQDEFKTAIAAESGLSEASTFLTHPPLTAVLFRADALVFGGEHMRVMPLFFGLISAVLLFFVVRRRFDERAALWAVFLYTISFYGIWSSLMLDTDGAILPALFIAALYCYDRARNDSKNPKLWLLLLIGALITGFLVKLSFVLVLGALGADVIFEKRKELSVKTLVSFGVVSFACILLLTGALLAVTFFNPAFSIGGMVSHALYYVHWSGRSYLQVIIQSLKAIFYLSPLLIAPIFFASKEVIKRTTPFLWYLALGFIFYFILFDFSRGALDKYLMFTIIPLSVISGAILSEIFASFSLRARPSLIVLGAVATAAVVALLFVPAEVVPLYPKTLWFTRVIRGDWDMLTAFNGGSGPVGFYVSFLFIVAAYIAASAAALAGLVKKSLLPLAASVLVFSGVAYNVAFMEEFSFGKLYGSTEVALASALAYIDATDDIKDVITYNDIGAYELKHRGKYASHFTAAPQFEDVARTAFSKYSGSFLVVDIPPLYDGFYRDFFDSCTIRFMARSGVIISTVYSSCTWTKE
ncbi:MAG: glycosyltransferase family 39 protein [Candidatus Paceibacterota bacterium]|jgi:4-amino-4-deoxy-L-arabinose transferase-like glycosyltransferase